MSRGTIDAAAASASPACFHWGDIEDLAAQLNLDESGATHDWRLENARFSQFRLEGRGGVGAVSYFVRPALRILMMDCAFDETREFHVRDDGWIRLNFSLDLHVNMAFGDQLSVQEERPSWRAIRVPSQTPVVEVVPADRRMRWVTICCRPEHIDRLVRSHEQAAMAPWFESDTQSEQVHYLQRRLTPFMASATEAMLSHPLTSRLRSAYVEAKAHELIILALDELYQISGAAAGAADRSPYVIRALNDARQILELELKRPPTVEALGRRVGLNRNKLQAGFRELFGVSVWEYLQTTRLTTARRLIEERSMSLVEVATAVGFGHQCNFSTAFKAHFGVSPSAIKPPD